MLDLKYLVDNTEEVSAIFRRRNGGDEHVGILNQVVALDRARRETLGRVEALKHQRNEASQEIANSKRGGGDASALMEKMKEVSQTIKELDQKSNEVQAELKDLMFRLPNFVLGSVPDGTSAADNKKIKEYGAPPEFSFEPKSHYDLGEALGVLDFKKAGEVTGSRFVFLKGMAARVNRALIQFMLDEHRKAGYEEMLPPFMVNRNTLMGTGHLPKFAEDVFHIEKYDYFLIPTAEVPVTNYLAGEIIDEKKLPVAYTAYTPCFRSEAGSYGKDTRGLKRQHQFDKVELVRFVHPDQSEAEHEGLTRQAESILEKLGLHYRTMVLCSGDMGFWSAKTYDIEVWSPFQKDYVEISSCSNFLDYQSRRANIRFRSADSKPRFLHTLNGSGLAIGRTLMAIMENFQKEDGTFGIPEVLLPYLTR